jgi:hypothetical protein
MALEYILDAFHVPGSGDATSMQFGGVKPFHTAQYSAKVLTGVPIGGDNPKTRRGFL